MYPQLEYVPNANLTSLGTRNYSRAPALVGGIQRRQTRRSGGRGDPHAAAGAHRLSSICRIALAVMRPSWARVQVGLTEKRNAQAGTLSGGQKRKLSISMALSEKRSGRISI